MPELEKIAIKEVFTPRIIVNYNLQYESKRVLKLVLILSLFTVMGLMLPAYATHDGSELPTVEDCMADPTCELEPVSAESYVDPRDAEIEKLTDENNRLKAEILDLRKQIEDLNKILMEQINVIMTTLASLQ